MNTPTRRGLAAAAALVFTLGLAPSAHAAFSPRLSVSVNPTTTGRAAALAVEIGQSSDDEAIRELRLALPGFAVGPGVLSWPACSGQAEQSGNCPSASRIGTASSTTGFGDFSGNVFYGGLSGEHPRVLVYLRNALIPVVADQKLVGRLEPVPGGQELVFEDMPGATATRFVLRFDAPDRGLVATPARCGGYDLLGRFTSAAGDQRQASSRVTIGGCPGARPTISRASLLPRTVASGRSATLTFALSEAASVRVLQRRAGTRRIRTVRRLAGRAGVNRVTGLARGLAAGRWVFTIKAATAAGTATRVLSVLVARARN
jgi:hypothetical protein